LQKVLAKVLAIAIYVFWSSVARSGECAVDRVDLRNDAGKASFSVEVVDDAGERAQGLMARSKMGASHGMLFVYPAPGQVSFWMKNTLIPLDMVFLDAAGSVRQIHENAVPLDLTPIAGGDDIQFVLEINGGLSKGLGIAVGSQLRHPMVDQSIAVWPCK
jgi:uncharacterized protein